MYNQDTFLMRRITYHVCPHLFFHVEGQSRKKMMIAQEREREDIVAYG